MRHSLRLQRRGLRSGSSGAAGVLKGVLRTYCGGTLEYSFGLLRFVGVLPGSKLSGTIFVLRVKTGDSGVP